MTFERIVIIGVDNLHWEDIDSVVSAYPSGKWYKATGQDEHGTAVLTGVNPPRRVRPSLEEVEHLRVDDVQPLCEDDVLYIVYGETVGRTVLGFCSTQFDETTINEETNARHVDVLPTLQSMADIGDVEHELEGVDLTEFRGVLAGYYEDESGSGLMLPDDSLGDPSNPIVRQKMEQMHKSVQESPDRLIFRTDNNREHLRALGYL